MSVFFSIALSLLALVAPAGAVASAEVGNKAGGSRGQPGSVSLLLQHVGTSWKAAPALPRHRGLSGGLVSMCWRSACPELCLEHPVEVSALINQFLGFSSACDPA